MATETVAAFIARLGLTMKAEWADSNPNMDDGADMDHWRCRIRKGRRMLTIPFSMGRGHHGEPPGLATVLDCVGSDAASVENAKGFEDWAGEFGLDTDSRKAEKTYKTCVQQSVKLKVFLGDDEYRNLLFNTERE